MPLTKTQIDKLKKDFEAMWAISPAKALKLLAKNATIKEKKAKS